MSYIEINRRYSDLAESSCCLSCGGAVNYSEVREGEICVDLGSGRGTDAIRLAETVGSGGRVYGIDISDGMIQKARDTASRLEVSNVEFIQSTLEKINLEDNCADLIISNEVFRILKKGGRFVVSDIYALGQVPEEYRNDPVAISECWAGSVTRNEYLEQLRRAGFSEIKILEESSPYEKGKVVVSSWTIAGKKPTGKCSCNEKV